MLKSMALTRTPTALPRLPHLLPLLSRSILRLTIAKAASTTQEQVAAVEVIYLCSAWPVREMLIPVANVERPRKSETDGEQRKSVP